MCNNLIYEEYRKGKQHASPVEMKNKYVNNKCSFLSY